MKVVFLAFDQKGYRGGPIVNARRLLPELKMRGHEVHALIFYSQNGQPSVEYFEKQGVKTHTHRLLPFIEQNIKWILEHIVGLQPDIFIANSFVAGWFASRWVRKSGIPTIAVHRNDDLFHWDMVDEFVLGRSEWAVSGLVCVSEYLRETVKACGPEHTQLTVIPSGVPINEYVAIQSDEGPLRIAYVGRLVQKQKRIFDVIGSLSVLMEAHSDVTVTLFGNQVSNELQEINEKIAERNLTERFYFAGSVEPENLHKQLVRHHILVLLSDYEGTPGAVMDGMACGLVPVCLKIPGGVQELVVHERTGILVGDRKGEFYRAINRLKNDVELRRRLGVNARKHIEKHYSLSVAADRWEMFFSDLLQDNIKRSKLKIPDYYSLPPVRKGLAREDHRSPLFLPPYIINKIQFVVNYIKGKKHCLFKNGAYCFINPRLRWFNIDKYFIRMRIYESLIKYKNSLSGLLLDVGCGQMPYKELLISSPTKITKYVGLDILNSSIHGNTPDLTWVNGRIPLLDQSVDSAICTEVLEHCPDPASVLQEIYRVLRPGGNLFLTVPFLWPLHEVPFDEYRYTPFSLKRHLADCSFSNIKITALGGWDASLAQMIGLWVRRRSLNRWLRFLLSCFAWPIVFYLIRLDKKRPVNISENAMITSILCTATK